MIPYISQRSQVVIDLFRHGCFPAYKTAQEALELLDEPSFKWGVEQFRIATNLPGDANDVAESNPIFFCAHKTVQFARASICKWPQPVIRWHTKGGLPGVSPEDFRDAKALGLSKWAAVCGIRPEYTANEKTAHLIAFYQPLDRKGNVLAQSGMPCFGNARTVNDGVTLQQMFDGEDWTLDISKAAQLMYLPGVGGHEDGHGVVGLEHQRSGNWMAATYDPRIHSPQADDIAEAVKRYGPPLADVPPAPTPTPSPTDDIVTIRVRGKLLSINGVNLP